VLGIQDKIQRATAPVQRRMVDVQLDTIASKATTSFLMRITEDKYGNTLNPTVDSAGTIACYIEFPNNEVPLLWNDPLDQNNEVTENGSLDNTNNQGNVLHFYDILPTLGYFKFEDCIDGRIRRDNVILYKVKIYGDSFMIIPLQIKDRVAKGTLTDITFIQYVLAPLTDGAILRNPTYQSLYNDFKNSDNW